MYIDPEIIKILKGIAMGAFYGAQANIYSYLSSEDLPLSWRALLTKKFWETFSWLKFGKTVLLGSVFGAIVSGYGFITPEQWVIFTEYTGLPEVPLSMILNFANTGVIIAVDRLTKLIVRRTPLIKGWDALKVKILQVLTLQEKAKKVIEEAKAAEIPSA